MNDKADGLARIGRMEHNTNTIGQSGAPQKKNPGPAMPGGSTRGNPTSGGGINRPTRKSGKQ